MKPCSKTTQILCKIHKSTNSRFFLIPCFKFYHHHQCVRYIDTDFNDRRVYQHIQYIFVIDYTYELKVLNKKNNPFVWTYELKVLNKKNNPFVWIYGIFKLQHLRKI